MKFDKLSDVSFSHPLNMPLIEVTLEVSQVDTLTEVRAEQPIKKRSSHVTFETSRSERSQLTIFVQP